MTSSLQRAFPTARQTDLYQKIVQAKSSNDVFLFDWLEAQWVHRYGLKTLPISVEEKQDLPASHETTLEKVNTKNNYKDKKIISFSLDNYNQETETETETETENYSKENISINNTLNLNQGDDLPLIEDKEEKLKTISPPPIPTLSHLRRWLPGNYDDIPKAS